MRRFVTNTALFGALFLLAQVRSAASQLVLSNESALAGATVLVPVVLTSQSAVSGIQFDVQFDSSALNFGAILGDAATNAAKGLYSSSVAPNRKRFLIIGMNQTAIADGTLLNLFVNISSTAASSVYVLTLANVVATDALGNAIAIASTNGSITVTATSGLQAGGIRSAASWLAGPVAPGEIITLVGSAIGPASAQAPVGSASSTILGGTSVLFDGAPAPLLYAGPNQINAVVPYAVTGKAATQLRIQSQGQSLSALSVPVALAVPGIFSLDSTGVGPGAVLNQDMTVNSPTNPAAKGSVIAIYGTGAGQTDPSGVDGQVAGGTLSHPLQAVSVQIGGVNANVEYAGAAPGLISGALQVNAVVPEGAPSGPSVPVVFVVGTASSQAGLTIAIR
jgi:uncharacterized protein (TIGR03437 family)